MSLKKVTAPPDTVALYQRLIESVEGADAKANFGSAYTAVNGNMYSMISKHGVVGIRLPEPERSEFLATMAPSRSEATRRGHRPRNSWPSRKRSWATPTPFVHISSAASPTSER
jgi:hypothetical protein